jgi:hypothetical protein
LSIFAFYPKRSAQIYVRSNVGSCGVSGLTRRNSECPGRFDSGEVFAVDDQDVVADGCRLTGSSRSGAVMLIERDLAGEALIDEPVKAAPFAPCGRLASCQGEIEAGIVASL